MELAGGRSFAGSSVNCPSGPIRTDNSVPTSLRLAARGRPVSRLDPEMPTSARGALTTIVPSGLAHHDVNDAHRGTPGVVAFQDGPAHLDRVVGYQNFA